MTQVGKKDDGTKGSWQKNRTEAVASVMDRRALPITVQEMDESGMAAEEIIIGVKEKDINNAIRSIYRSARAISSAD